MLCHNTAFIICYRPHYFLFAKFDSTLLYLFQDGEGDIEEDDNEGEQEGEEEDLDASPTDEEEEGGEDDEEGGEEEGDE